MVALLSAGAILGIAICASTFVAYLAQAAPDLALRVSSPAGALVDKANGDLTSRGLPAEGTKPSTSAQTAGKTHLTDRELAGYAHRALASEPLNSGALLLLGKLAVARGDAAAARSAMNAAASRNPHEVEALDWLIRDSAARGDLAKTALHANQFLSVRPGAVRSIGPALATLIRSPEGRKHLAGYLGEGAIWRSSFFYGVPSLPVGVEDPYHLLDEMKAAPIPPRAADMRAYLRTLMELNHHEFAYSVWLQFQSRELLSEIGFLNNGDFERVPDGLPFDWTLGEGAGSTVRFEPVIETGGQALFVEFGLGRIAFSGVRQTTMLAPGNYRLSGRFRGGMQAERGLAWRVSCLGKTSTLLGASDMFIRPVSTWTEFEVQFVVPDSQCPSQRVALELNARLQSERLLSGSLWFDKLRVVRERAVE